MRDENVSAAVVPKPRPDVLEMRLVGDVSIGDPVCRRCPWTDRYSRLHQFTEAVLIDDTISHPDRSQLHDLSRGDVVVRRLDVDGGEVAERRVRNSSGHELQGLEQPQRDA